MLKVQVEVYQSIYDFEEGRTAFRMYQINHDCPEDRRVLGQQCRNAFEGGQLIVTYPAKALLHDDGDNKMHGR